MRSTDRFLTTHTGSLPRPDDLIRMMYAKEEGVPVERAALGGARARRGGRGGEEAGRGRHRHRQRRRDVEAELCDLREGPARGLRRHRQHLRLPGPRGFPQSGQARVRRSRAGRGARRRPATPPIGVRDPDAAQADVDNLKAALGAVPAKGGFMSAASPGVVSLFFRNDHYPSQEAYLFAIAEAMRARIRDGRRGRHRAADRLPRSRHGPAHPICRTRASRNFASAPACMSRRSITRSPTSRRSSCACTVLGQLRRPAPLRRAARRHHRHRVHGAADRDLVRGRQSAPCARMDAVRDG